MPINADPSERTVSLRRPLSHRPATLRSPSEALEPLRAPQAPRRRRVVREEEPSKAKGVLTFLNGMVTFALFALILGWVVVDAAVQRFEAPGLLQKPTPFSVKEGETTRSVAERLVSKDLGIFEASVENGMVLRGAIAISWLNSWLGIHPREGIKAGEYELPKGASMRHVLAILNRGVSVQLPVLVHPGLTSYQIVEQLKGDQSLSGEVTEVPAEGTLLPETYNVRRGDMRQSLIDRMQRDHARVMKELWAKRAQNLPLRSLEEAVVLASIVQREMGRFDDPSRIAAVFINRLRGNQKLESDPTILYGLYKGAVVWNKAILASEKASQTPFNTYFVKGLPPTPICNPSKTAVQAVLNPAQTEELFFVSLGDGKSLFAKSYAEHQKNVRELRRVEAERNARLQQQNQQQQTPPPAQPQQATPPAPAATVAPKNVPVRPANQQTTPRAPAKPKPPAKTQPAQ
ncbi:MAG: endolytic transglycosylase MltG [Hyphomicrobiaceae bacterium]|nr:MAG: endolytic transglycosylase MltG [Hyphomicrobiaceae bacterium]